MHSGECLLQYHGHSGSVNSVRFHLSKELVLTCNGDGTARSASSLHNESSSGSVAVGSSEDKLEWMEDGAAEDAQSQIPTLRTPLQTLTGHSGLVISGDWVMSGDQVTHGRYQHYQFVKYHCPR